MTENTKSPHTAARLKKRQRIKDFIESGKAEGMKQKDIAERFGVAHGYIWKIQQEIEEEKWPED